MLAQIMLIIILEKEDLIKTKGEIGL